jgi:hypothetical protein
MPKLTGFRYDVKAKISMTGREMAALRRLALLHDDSKCRSIALRGAGGWLRGAILMAVNVDPAHYDGEFEDLLTDAVESENPTVELTLSFPQIDTLCKILEMNRFARDEDRLLLAEMTGWLSTLIGALRDKAACLDREESVVGG